MSRSQRLGLGSLLLLQLVLGVLAATWLLPWLGHEPDYFNNVRHLVDTGALPARSDFEGAARGAEISQATQGPVFFFVAAPLVALLDDGAPVPPAINPRLVCDGTVADESYLYALTTAYNPPLIGAAAAGLGLRVLNLLFALGTTATVYFTARQIPPRRHSVALVAAAFIALLPQAFELSVFISGESLLLLVSSLNLYFAIRLLQGTAVRLPDLAGLIGTVVLGLLVKTNGYALVIGTVGVLLYLGIRHTVRAPRSASTRLLAAAVVVLLAALAAVSIFNLVQYGSVVGRYQNLLSMALAGLQTLSVEKLAYTVRDTFLDYGGAFPIQREKLILAYSLGALVGIATFIGVTVARIVRREWSDLSAYFCLALYFSAAVALVLVRGNLTDPVAPDKAFAPVRYYVAGLPAFAIMSAIGWNAVTRTLFENRIFTRAVGVARIAGALSSYNGLGFAWAAVWLAVVLFFVRAAAQNQPANFVLSSSAFREPLDQRGLQTVSPDGLAAPDMPRLTAYEVETTDDGILELTAYMTIDETPLANQMAIVAMTDSRGVTQSCEVLPQQGRFTVTRWEPGQRVIVPIRVPNCVTEPDSRLTGPLEVSIRWQAVDTSGHPVGPPSESVSLLKVDADLARSSACLGNLGVIGDVFQVTQYTGPTSLVAGQSFLPSVNWLVRDASAAANLQRMYVMTHETTGRTYTCQGQPRLGDYPIEQWSRGEVVYFDQCNFALAADTPLGDYTLSIGLIDTGAGQLLPVVPAAGTASAPGLLAIATLNVVGP